MKRYGLLTTACLLVLMTLAPGIASSAASRVPGDGQDVTTAPVNGPKKALYTVQFAGPIGDPALRALAAADAVVHGYLGEFTFLVGIAPANVKSLSANTLVRSVTKNRPETKFNPASLKKMKVRLHVTTVPGEETAVATTARGLGGQVAETGHGSLTLDLNGSAISALALDESVLAVDEEKPIKVHNDVVRGLMTVSGTGSPWANGLDGTGQVVGVADTGLDSGNVATLHPDLINRLQATPIAKGRPGDWSDLVGHGTHVAATVLGDGTASGGQYKGVAPGAKLVFQSLATSSGGLTISSVSPLLSEAEALGAKIHSDSWGVPYTSGGFAYDYLAADVDGYMWQHKDFLAVFAVGNDGPQNSTVTSPSTAKNVIAVGASESLRPEVFDTDADNANQVATFSSRGPGPNGLIKPDLVAPGSWVISARSSAAPANAYSDLVGTVYGYMSGTSMATPAVSGAATLVRQYYMDVKGVAAPAASLLKATLINGAVDLGYGWMSKDQGWGRVDLTNSLYPTGGRVNWFENEGAGLATGQSQNYSFNVDNGQLFKITLVWTDRPGSTSATVTKKLVNDLDLEVTGPDGKVYKGNCFASNTAATTCTAFDRSNNVENVYFAAPAGGTYTVKVNGYNIPQGPQPYSLVVSGNNLRASGGPRVSVLGVNANAKVGGILPITAQVAAVEPVDRVDYYVDNALSASVTAGPSYAWNWNTALLADGAHTLVAKAYDVTGALGTITVPVTVDNTLPTVAITAPAAGAGVKGSLAVTANAADAGGVAKVEFYADGTLLSTDTASPYSWTWNTAGVSAGVHSLTAKAYDGAGNVATSPAVSVTVDNELPTVALTAPAALAILRQSVTVSANAADNAAVARVDFLVDNVVKGTVSTAPYTWTWNTATATNASHNVTATAYDAAGNAATSTAVSVTVDNQAPTVSISAPVAGAMVKGTVMVTATAADNKGLAKVEFFLDGALVGSDTATPYAWSWDSTTGTAGSHTLQAKAYDLAGNVTTSALNTVTVDNTSPTVSLTGLTGGATVVGTKTVGANAADNAAVAKVEFYLDNALKATDTTSPYAWDWVTTTATNGSHTVVAKAYDTAGNVTASTPVTVTVDLPPTISITTPKAASVVHGAIAVAVTAADTVGVTKVELYADGVLATSSNTAPFGLTWNSALVPDGSHSLTAKAYDAAGNITTSAAVTIKVDNQVPVLSLVSPSSGATVIGTVTVTATATDNVGVTKVEFYLDNALKVTDTASPYTWSWVTTTATNGSHNLQVKAYDAAGNVAAVTATVNVDLPPVVNGLTFSSGVNACGTVTVTADATDAVGVTQVEFYVDGVIKGSVTASPYAWSWDTTGFTNGNHTVQAKVYDAAGNMTASKGYSIKVDNAAPAVTLTAPAAGSTVPVKTTVTATATDNTGVSKVEFYVDGTLAGNDTLAPYSLAWDTTGLTAGSHTLTAKAYDLAGNAAMSPGVTVTVDNQVPTVSVTAPAAGAVVRQSVTITAAATDSLGVTKVEILVDGALKQSLTTAPYTFTWNTATGVTNAAHTITAKAYDAAGNVTVSIPVSVTVDNLAPAVSLSAPAAAAQVKGTVPVNATATDNQGVTRVEFYVDGALAGTDTATPFTYAWDTTTAAGGSHDLTAKAYDAAGNVTTSAVRSVTVDNTAPAVSVTGLTGGATVIGTVTVGATATDNIGVAKTEFYLDGTLKATDATSPYSWDWVTTTATGGSHTVAVKAYDLVGNVTTTAPLTVTVDLPPTVSITAPKAAARLRGTVAVTATATDTVGVTKVELYADGTAVTSDTTAPYSLAWDTTLATDGTHALTVKAFDAAGNIATSSAVSVTVDNAAPVVTLTVPADGATVTGTVAATATATDNVGVSKVEFYLDGTLKTSDTTSPYIWSWVTTTAANGSHSVQVKAYDATENVTTVTANVTVDLPPVVSGITVSSGTSARGTVTVTANATDAVGVTGVEFYVDGALKGTVAASPYTWAWDTTGFPDGLHSVQARAYDAALNMTASQTLQVKVDNQAPAVTLTAPADGAAVPVRPTLTATASDNVGVVKVEFYVDGELKNADTAAPYSWVWDAANLTPGSYELTAKAYDVAGNVTTSAKATVMLDNQVPSASLTAPTAGAVLRQTVTVTADAADNNGLTKVEFLVDGAVKNTLTAAPFTWDWNTATATNAAHSLTVKAYDAAGNVTTSAAVSVTTDNQAPTASITAPANNAKVKGTVAVAINATDNRGVVSVDFLVDDILVSTDTASPWAFTWDSTTASNGTFALKAVARDAVGNAGTSGAVTVSVDNTAPVINLTGLTDGATVTGTRTLTATATDNENVTKVEFYLDNVMKKSCLAADCTWDWVTTTAANGSHTVVAKAYDAAGNVTATAPVTVTVDLPPAVSITAPKAGNALRGTVTAAVTATDAVGVTKVELYASGTLVATATAGPFSLAWDTTQGANGSYTLTAKAYDAAGNITTSAPVTVTVDNTVPVLSLTSPTSGAKLLGTVDVKATATDNVAVTKVEFVLDGVVKATDTASPYSWSWTTTTATDGSHNVEARAYDAAGNMASAAVDVTVDLPPVISAFTFSNGAAPARGTVTVALNVADPADVTKVEFYADSVLKESTATAPATWLWDTTAYTNGSHSVQAKVYDAGGNITLSALQTVKVDNQAPTVSVTAPADGSTVPGRATVTASAADNAAVIKLEFLVDGVVTNTDTAAPYSWSWDTTAGTNGAHVLTAKAYDAAGNETTSAPVTVTVEYEAPQVSITAPGAGALLRQSVTVSADATDNVAVTKVEFLVDGVLKQSMTAGPYDWTWNTTTATNAAHSLAVKAYDAAGNVATSAALSVIVDNQAPAVVIGAPAKGSTVTGTVNITATASDARGIAQVEFYIDGNLAGSDDAAPFASAWDTTTATNGSHSLMAKAYDLAGNVTSSAAITVTVSN